MARPSALRRLPRTVGVPSDPVLAAVLLAAGALELAVTDVHGSRAATLAALVLVCAPVAVRLRHPLAAMTAGLTVALAGFATTGLDWLFTPLPVLMLLVGTAAAAAPDGRRLAAVAAVAVAASAATLLLQPSDGSSRVGQALWVLLVVALLPIGAGRTFRHHAQLTALLRERAGGLERQRAAGAQRAAARERERIAAELHDVVAHGVSAMVVQAAAARRLVLAGGDAAVGGAAIAEVEASGREALDELRRLLGVLRRGDEALALAPQPSLARVDRLVGRLRDEGLPVALTIEGDVRPLPLGLDVTAHRIVEEALGDVLRRPGATHVDVSVRYRPRELELEVSDDAPGAAPAHTAALGERVALFRGDLSAGRRRGGGRTVRARLPLEGRPA